MTHPRKGRKSAATLSFVPKGRIAAHGAASFPCAAQGSVSKGAILFHKRECPPLDPPRERFRLAVWGLNYFDASGMQLPARGEAAFSIAIRFASAPTTRCRSAHLVEVQPNFRLTEHCSMRRAQQCRSPHAVCRRCERHSRLTIVRRGCERQRLAEASWRSHVHRTHTAQRVQSFKNKARNVGGRGGLPSPFSGGFKGGILFGKRIPPLVSRRARRSPSRARTGSTLFSAVALYFINTE